jgi:lipopolysaccharide transport system permease protein
MSQLPSAASPVPPREGDLIIEPGRAAAHYWRDLWRFRELLWFLAWRDIVVRYKQAALGAAWALVQPLITMVIFTFVFSNLAHMASGKTPYSLLVLAGLLPWQLFASALAGSSSSVVSNTNLISKIYFPRLIVPLSSLGVAMADFLVTVLLYTAFAVAYGVWPTWRILLLPAFILITLVIALGAGLWLSALMVKYRDFRYIVPFLLQFGIFATPVGYRTDILHTYGRLLAINPLTGVIAGFRWSLLGADFALDPMDMTISIGGAAVFLLSGLWYFRKTERLFADII